MAIAEWIETARQLWDGPLKPVQDFWEIGAALVAGFAAYRVFRSRRIREMDSLLKGDRARRDDLTRKKEARTNALRQRTILAARLDGEIDELKTRTAEHALGRAAAERAELNHEAAARARRLARIRARRHGVGRCRAAEGR